MLFTIDKTHLQTDSIIQITNGHHNKKNESNVVITDTACDTSTAQHPLNCVCNIIYRFND